MALFHEGQVAGALLWRQPTITEEGYTLHLGDAEDAPTIARLRWQGSFTTRALAETGAGSWTFERSGSWRPSVTIRDAHSGAECGLYQSKGPGGTLTLADGWTFGWSPTDFWRANWQWTGRDGQLLAKFTDQRRFVRQQGLVEVPAIAWSAPELALLVILGWYLMLLQAKDNTAVIAATTSH